MPVKGVIKPTTIAQGGGGAGMGGVSGPVTGSFTGPTPSTSMMQARECVWKGYSCTMNFMLDTQFQEYLQLLQS